jgi:hypothetical protein
MARTCKSLCIILLNKCHLLILSYDIARSEKKGLSMSSFVMWRGFQTYNTLLNTCLAQVMYPVMVSAWSILIVIGLYTGIRLFGTIPTAMYLLLILLATDGLFMDMFGFRMAGDVDGKSHELLKKWRVSLSKTSQQSKLKRKTLLSCAPLRVKLGSSNYIEVCTPLVILDLCLDQVVTLLIAS